MGLVRKYWCENNYYALLRVKANVNEVSAEVAVKLILVRKDLDSLWVLKLGIYITGGSARLRHKHHQLCAVVVRNVINFKETRSRHIFTRHAQFNVPVDYELRG